MSKSINTYTEPLTESQVEKLRTLLDDRGFEFVEKPYAIYSGKKGKLNVTVYEKGPKVLVQGKETADFVQFTLEPEILGEAKLGYEEIHQPEMFEPHIGVDESGKGDFFGPLVIAGAYVDAEISRHLLDQGIMDSKRITSDARIRNLSDLIRSVPGIAWEIVQINPGRYNELYDQFGNLNRMLAWGHATVIENVLAKRPECPRALSDQFANPSELIRALQKKGKSIEVQQRTKAESDVAVAAASILAREAFIDWIDDTGEHLEVEIPKGASAKVKETGKLIVENQGAGILNEIAKVHFRTADEILDENS
ncbi:MAG: ribonuclease HIII [Verrucomicrobiales bacterium]|nr:ribonuclease HIII [Verrucomicrobiales bacterium]